MSKHNKLLQLLQLLSLTKLLLSKNGSNKFKIQSLYLFFWTFCIKMLNKNSTYYLKMNSSNTKNKIGEMLNIIFKYACLVHIIMLKPELKVNY